MSEKSGTYFIWGWRGCCSVENTPFRNPQRMIMIDVLANQLHYHANHSTVNEPNVELFNYINVLSHLYYS